MLPMSELFGIEKSEVKEAGFTLVKNLELVYHCPLEPKSFCRHQPINLYLPKQNFQVP